MRKLIPVLIIAAVLTGCATQSKYAGSSYSGTEARRGAVTRTGVLIAIAPVTISDNASGIGALAGAGLGGLAAGTSIGAGNGAIAAGAIGALVGLVAGNALESQMNTHNAVRLTVRLDNNTTVTTVQGMDADAAGLRLNDRVYVFDQAGTLRVSR